MHAPGDRLDEARRIIGEAAAESGRDASALGMEGRIGAGPDAARHAAKWRDAAATHVTVDTMRLGHEGVAGHLAALEQAAKELGL